MKELGTILEETKTIAVVGLSPNPDRPSHDIAKYLQAQGYRIIPVNPTVETVLGERSYPNLLAIPFAVDVVQIFRRPEEVSPIVDQAIQIGAKVVWMQPGIVHEGAAAKARAAGLKVVMDRCMRATHRQVSGGGSKHGA
ncbi:MAG: CoA-binding protein [Armatimonadetes bacterium]|nr:CoA-binding protein [Armatimonadota bacterium]